MMCCEIRKDNWKEAQVSQNDKILFAHEILKLAIFYKIWKVIYIYMYNILIPLL
jgi:hypothetical protein